MSLWKKIKNFFFPSAPQPTYMDQLKDIIEEEEKAKKPKRTPSKAKKAPDEKLQ